MDSSPRPNPDRPERERLLESMLRVAAAKGLETATVADVIAAAEVDERTFYSLFEGKEACFLDAYDVVVDVMLARATRALEERAEQPWPRRIAAALAELVELFAAEAAITRMVMIEIPATGGVARAHYSAAMDRLTPFLEEGRDYAPGGSDLPDDTARLAVGGGTSIIFDELRSGRGAELERILPELVFAVLMPYLGPAAAQEEMRRVATARET